MLTKPHTSVVYTSTRKVCLEFIFSAFSCVQMFKFVWCFFFLAKIYNWADRWCISLHSSEYVTVAGDSLLIGTKTGQLLMCSVKESSSFNNRFDGKPAQNSNHLTKYIPCAIYQIYCWIVRLCIYFYCFAVMFWFHLNSF